MYNITKPQHKIRLSGDVVSHIALGSGLIIDDPLRPSPAPVSPFATAKVTVVEKVPIDRPSILDSTTAFVESVSDHELADTIYANLNGAFGFGSVNAAYSRVKPLKEHHDVIVALIGQQTTGPSIPETSERWITPPESEEVSDDIRLAQFVREYGSHYVQAIAHGYRVAIFGSFEWKTEKIAWSPPESAVRRDKDGNALISCAHKRAAGEPITGLRSRLRKRPRRVAKRGCRKTKTTNSSQANKCALQREREKQKSKLSERPSSSTSERPAAPKNRGVGALSAQIKSPSQKMPGLSH
jgi:hypothetical protein